MMAALVLALILLVEPRVQLRLIGITWWNWWLIFVGPGLWLRWVWNDWFGGRDG